MDQKVLLTTPQVAKRLGVSVRRVQALIHAGRLPSQQFGRDHVIKEEDLALVAVRKRGRPPKNLCVVDQAGWNKPAVIIDAESVITEGKTKKTNPSKKE